LRNISGEEAQNEEVATVVMVVDVVVVAAKVGGGGSQTAGGSGQIGITGCCGSFYSTAGELGVGGIASWNGGGGGGGFFGGGGGVTDSRGGGGSSYANPAYTINTNVQGYHHHCCYFRSTSLASMNLPEP